MVTSAQTPDSPGANSSSEDNAEISTARNYTLAQLGLYALKLGTVGFGGPVALVEYMHRDLVERRKWISEADYKEGLTLAQLMPGPLAAQLAIYLGYVDYGILGATLVGVAFVVPSFLMVCALGWAYVAYGGLAWMQAVFYGIGAAVIGIITLSAYKLTVKSIGKDKLLWIIYLISMVRGGAGMAGAHSAEAISARCDRRQLHRFATGRAARHSCGDEQNPLADLSLLYQSRRFRLRQRAGHRPIPARRRGQGVWVAE